MTPEKLAALADCPFCNRGAWIIASKPYYPRWGPTWRPQCRVCGASLGEFDSEAAAITAWNTRARPQGYAAGVEAAAKVAEKFAAGYVKAADEEANGSESYWARCKEAGEVLSFIATAIRALSSADAVVDGWRVTLSDAQRMVLGEAVAHDVQQADLFKTHATEDEKWRRIGLKIEIAINRLLELGA